MPVVERLGTAPAASPVAMPPSPASWGRSHASGRWQAVPSTGGWCARDILERHPQVHLQSLAQRPKDLIAFRDLRCQIQDHIYPLLSSFGRRLCLRTSRRQQGLRLSGRHRRGGGWAAELAGAQGAQTSAPGVPCPKSAPHAPRPRAPPSNWYTMPHAM